MSIFIYFSKSERLTSTGLNDEQMNQFISMKGFKDVGVGYAAINGDILLVKSGFVRLLCTPDHKHYSIPNSMTSEDWALINAYRTLCKMKILIFITREYCFKKFIRKRGRRAQIPTDAEIIANYCITKFRGKKNEELWKYRQTHSALLLIDGTKFRLFDANNFHGLDKSYPGNFFVQDFFDIFKKRCFPHIYLALGLKARDTKDYQVVKCHYSKGLVCFSIKLNFKNQKLISKK